LLDVAVEAKRALDEAEAHHVIGAVSNMSRNRQIGRRVDATDGEQAVAAVVAWWWWTTSGHPKIIWPARRNRAQDKTPHRRYFNGQK